MEATDIVLTSGAVDYEYLNPADEQVQEFLWRFMNPKDIHYSYTKFDAMKHIMDQLLTRRQSLYGDMVRGIAVRVEYPMPHIAVPHILGNAAYVRGLCRIGIPTTFAMGMKYIQIVTRFEPLIKILTPFGFKVCGRLPEAVMNHEGEPTDAVILTLSKADFFKEEQDG